MKTSHAVDALAALAQEPRIEIFRLLVRYSPHGLPAGAIARRLRLPGPTLSFHLNVPAAGDLIRPRKNGGSISYSANPERVNRLTAYLMEKCCGGPAARECAPPAEAGKPSRPAGPPRTTAAKEPKRPRGK